MNIIKQRIADSIETKQRILADDMLVRHIETAAMMVSDALKSGGKILLCGNGGSASDALHIAGEIVGRFQKERKSYPAIALNADVATMTAIANDYGYDTVFERAVEGYMKSGDVIIGISTSGNSENVRRAIAKASELGGKSIALLGKDGGKIAGIADCPIIVPSNCTARIQESHIMIGHIICEIAECDIPPAP